MMKSSKKVLDFIGNFRFSYPREINSINKIWIVFNSYEVINTFERKETITSEPPNGRVSLSLALENKVACIV